MRKTIRVLSEATGWRPPMVSHLTLPHHLQSDRNLVPQEKAFLKQKRTPQYKPISLKAREHLVSESDSKRYHTVTEEWIGQRVDDFLIQHYPEWNGDAVQKLVEGGHVYRYTKNGYRRYTRLTDRLQFDELIVVPTSAMWQKMIPPKCVVEEATEKESLPLSSRARQLAHEMVIFKNEHVIVINKPSGVPVAKTRGVEINLTDMLPAWKYTAQHPPLFCHLLDRETSGCMVMARSKDAHRMLGRMFTRRFTPNNVYWAYCVGQPQTLGGRLKVHLENDNGMIIARPMPSPDSKVAVAEFVVNHHLAEFGSFVSFYPMSNLRHQLRIMAAHGLRCPILGDGKFGGEAAFPSSLSVFWKSKISDIPLHLHHRKIQLPYKNGVGKFICVTAPLPQHMKDTFTKVGWDTEVDDPLIPS